jgi:hypothetical protein
MKGLRVLARNERLISLIGFAAKVLADEKVGRLMQKSPDV